MFSRKTFLSQSIFFSFYFIFFYFILFFLARHGVNGSSNAHNDDSEVTNDTRMINNANPVQQTAPASQKLPSKPIGKVFLKSVG